FMGDPSAVVASLLAGDVHVAGDEAIGFEQGVVLKQEWASRGDGVVILTPNKSRFVQVQFKPEYVNPKAILDVRVRKAILLATDRTELSAAILDGDVAVADSIAGPVEEYFAELDRVVTRYPFNKQNADRLMNDAGYTRSGEGFVDSSGQRFGLELRSFAAEPAPREAAILSSQWSGFGIDTTLFTIAAAQSQNLELVSAYPAFRLEQTGLTDTVPINKLGGASVA